MRVTSNIEFSVRKYRRKSGKVLALMLLSFSLFAPSRAGAEQPRFYLSTDRMFSPSDKDISVRLEARDVSAIDMRLYKVPDPEKFFKGQSDLHRIETQNGPSRVSSLDVGDELWRLSAKSFFDAFRNSLQKRAKKVVRELNSESVRDLENVASGNSVHNSALPLLKDLVLVDMWTEDMGEKNGWVYRNVAITTRKPGVYLVEAIWGQEVGYTVVVISNVVLLTRQSKEKLLVFAVDPKLGNPVPNVGITLLQDGEVLGKGNTDSEGLWQKSIPLVRKMTIFARKGEDFALLDPSYHPANSFSRKVYIATERPVYRPGQEVFFKGIIRAFEGESYKMDPASEVAVRVLDPNGQEVFSEKLKVRAGSFDGKFRLFDSSSLGMYRLAAVVDEKDYGSEFKVKAYRKPEYKVSVSTEKRAYVSGEKVNATVSAKYYFGPAVQDAKVKVTVYRTKFFIPWWIDADYSWYYSDSEYRNTIRETIDEFEGSLDKEGEFKVDFETSNDSRDYTYGIEAVVTDASSRSVTGSTHIKVTKARYRLVIEPEYLLNAPGVPAVVKVLCSDYSRKPVSSSVKMKVLANTMSADGTAHSTVLLEKEIHIDDSGKASLEFKPEKGGTYVVHGTSDDGHGNKVEASAMLYVTSKGGDIPYAPRELQIISDKKTYDVGDRVRFLILTPHADAHLLTTVEGGKLYAYSVIRAKGHSAVFEMPITEAQSPNFFLRVAEVFDGNEYHRRLDVVVPPREKLLHVTLDAEPKNAKPGDKVSVTASVTDYKGQPVQGAELALAIVDEAIYGISPELAIPIERFFYHRKRNDVRSSCSISFRFYGYGETSKDKMASLYMRQPVLPGSFKSLASAKVRTKFKDTMAWYPALVTDENGKVTLSVKVPDNLTTWRLTARTITKDTRVGQGIGGFVVSKPLLLRLAVPGFLVEKDRSRIGLIVHNYTDKKRVLKVKLEVSGPLTVSEAPPELTVSPRGMSLVPLDVLASGAGDAEVRASVEDSSLSDALSIKIPILRYGMKQALLAGGVLDDANPDNTIELDVPASAVSDSVKASVDVSTGIAPALLSSLDYLTGYPYGCTEQTMSRFLPDLVVAKALKDLGVENKSLDDKLPGYIQAGLSRLAQLQHSDGGWGWWKNDDTDPIMTAYVVQGLSIAKRTGWKTNTEMLNRGANRLKSLVRSSELSSTERSYLLYSMALAGVKYPSMVSKLTDDRKLTQYGQATLALALFELGQKEKARQLTSSLELAVHRTSKGSWWGGSEDAQLGWQKDPVETTAAVLRTLLMSKPDSMNINEAVKWLMSRRQGEAWASTRDTAMVVFALVDYLKKFAAKDFSASVNVSMKDRKLHSVTLTKTLELSGDDLFKPSIKVFQNKKGHIGHNEISIRKKGSGSIYYNASMTYFGREKNIKPKGSFFNVTRSYFKLNKERKDDGWVLKTSPLTAPVHSGDEILVVLHVQVAKDADYILIEDPFPAGTQAIDRDRGYDIKGIALRVPQVHREFGDQRAAFFVPHASRGEMTLAYLLRATLPGDYNVMPARVMPMYDPQFAGNSSNTTIKVED